MFISMVKCLFRLLIQITLICSMIPSFISNVYIRNVSVKDLMFKDLNVISIFMFISNVNLNNLKCSMI
jgi:hypothetical protein